MGGHPHRGPNQQHARGNDNPFAKVKFRIPPFYGLYDAEAYLDWEMIVDNKFSSHLVPEQHHVRQATSVLSGGMNYLAFVYNLIHGIV
jgi:hypothetical protein